MAAGVPRPTSAAVGANLARFDPTVTAGIPRCPTGSARGGIAYDGTNLLLSCRGSNVVQRVNAASGANDGPIMVTGVTDLAALTWDPNRNRLWACDNTNLVVAINMTTGAVDPSITPFVAAAGCIDGMHYDVCDDTMWLTPGQPPFTDNTVYHYRLNGLFISFDSAGMARPMAPGGDLVRGHPGPQRRCEVRGLVRAISRRRWPTRTGQPPPA